MFLKVKKMYFIKKQLLKNSKYLKKNQKNMLFLPYSQINNNFIEYMS